MNDASPYSPDRSLLHAILVLVGGVGLVAGGIYLVTAFEVPLTRWQDQSLSEARSDARPRAAPQASRSPVRTGGGGGIRRGDVSGGGVPAWARSEPSPAPPRRPAPSLPQVSPDFGHAQLGAPSPSDGAPPGPGAVIADAETPGGAAADAGRAPSALTFGNESAGGEASGRGDEAWRSEARTLASRSRALSREVARLNRESASSGAAAQREQAEQPSGEASTASSRGGAETNTPGTPDNPDQVPLGGAEWLAAAGAAYALNRLRKENDDDPEGEA